MKEQNESNDHEGIVLQTPAGAPYGYSIRVDQDQLNPQLLLFSINDNTAGNDAATKTYQLQQRDHSSYLDLFEQLANDFGLRMPQNRRPVHTPTFKVNYTEVLTENMDAGMLYGYGDPAVLHMEDGQQTWYYLLATSNDAANSFPILRSNDLKDWEFVDYVFPQERKPTWAADGEMISDYWAPEMHKVNGEFRVYFVARDKQTKELCIGLARSTNPAGPFIADDQPILTGNVIDPHVFVVDNNIAYLYWKEDNNDVWPGLLLDLLYEHPLLIRRLCTDEADARTACFITTLWPWAKQLQPMERFQAIQVFIEVVTERYTEFYTKLQAIASENNLIKNSIQTLLRYMKTPMYAQQLSTDGSSLIGDKVKVIENDQPWEAHLVEGIWVTKQSGKFYLFYAGNDFSTEQYGIGVAIGNSPLGPFIKMNKPLLQSTAQWTAPGHPSVANGPGGQPLLFLHAYYSGKAGYKQFRVLLTAPLQFDGDTVSVLSS